MKAVRRWGSAGRKVLSHQRQCISQGIGGEVFPWYKHFVIPTRLKVANLRLVVAMSSYAILAVIAIFALDGFLRSAVLFLFALLAVKTIAHSKDEVMK